MAQTRPSKSISATNLAIYQHLECDLYIHKVYNNITVPDPRVTTSTKSSERTRSYFKRGNDWETTLYSWLDRSQLLLRFPSIPLDPDNLLEIILADGRDHFFITDVTFQPPQSKLVERFTEKGTQALQFGIAKPDLIEITKTESDVRWRVIDAKAARHIKSSHHVQIYFYSMCLGHLLDCPPYKRVDSIAVWLPPNDGLIPSFENINVIPTSFLSPMLDTILFSELPRVIGTPEENVKWHYNPLCRTCPFERGCKTRSEIQGSLGSMPNISLDDAKMLQHLLKISGVHRKFPTNNQSTDIEDLHMLISNPDILRRISTHSPTYVKRAKRLLAFETNTSSRYDTHSSPVVEAARTRQLQMIQRRNLTCPSREDIAIIITILTDPSLGSSSDYFCVTTHSESGHDQTLPIITCSSTSIIHELANVIRTIHEFQSKSATPSTSQFYVWSLEEYKILEDHIINAALNSSFSDRDIQVCISALAQGTSLLQTTFQPLILSGALLNFLSNWDRTPNQYRSCLERLGLATDGTTEVMRERIKNEIDRLQEGTNGSNRKEIGQLPLVVILKQEIERQIALPIAGYWDLHECSAYLLTSDACPTDDQLFTAHRNPLQPTSNDIIIRRNDTIYHILKDLRRRSITASGKTLLVNEAKPIMFNFTVMCEEPNIRKLFFMQQFEALSTLKELWKSRINGCPDSPVVEYLNTTQEPSNLRHRFRLVSGRIDTPSSEKRPALYDQLLVPEPTQLTNGYSDASDIPLEALFDDLGVCGLLFPPNSYTSIKWSRQETKIKTGLYLADVQQVYTNNSDITMVDLRIWGSVKFWPEPGTRYRLSTRFVDFNTVKILSALIDIDLYWSYRRQPNGADGHRNVPFLQLISDPLSLSDTPSSKVLLKLEENIQKLFRDLKALGNDQADSLVLKPSQHKAARHLLSHRLTTIWGPPGTGKTHTLCLSLLRLLEVEHRHYGQQRRMVFITAATHAAIEACQRKLIDLIDTYKGIEWTPKKWLNDITVEIVYRGNNHPAPLKESSRVYIYAGTVYQLFNFSKKHNIEVDCVVIDEAGQVLLVSISLVLRTLRDTGRIVVAGDSQQLAPILNARYPSVKPTMLFGSVIDCLMSQNSTQNVDHSGDIELNGTPHNHSTEVVQLTENFRLNPDIGEFISTIYSKEFKAQKSRAIEFASAVTTINAFHTPFGIKPSIFEATRQFLTSLSNVISERHQQHLAAPKIHIPDGIYNSQIYSDTTKSKRPISLTLIRTVNAHSLHPYPYDWQIRREADIASSLVLLLQQYSPRNSVFVATPHRIQRDAVRTALSKANVAGLKTTTNKPSKNTTMSLRNVTIDTIERLQGSEADFVICLFSSLQASTQDALFLLERRRLNVAISRTKTLCILVTCDDLLQPPVKILSSDEALKGYTFLKAYEERAWIYKFPVDINDTP